LPLAEKYQLRGYFDINGSGALTMGTSILGDMTKKMTANWKTQDQKALDKAANEAKGQGYMAETKAKRKPKSKILIFMAHNVLHWKSVVSRIVRKILARISYAIAVLILLVGIVMVGAVVVSVGNAIAILVLVAHVANTIVVLVFLIWIVVQLAVVAHVAYPIAVGIRLLWVFPIGAIVAGVADVVAIGIALVGIISTRAIVGIIGNAVFIHVFRNQHCVGIGIAQIEIDITRDGSRVGIGRKIPSAIQVLEAIAGYAKRCVVIIGMNIIIY